MHAEVTRRGVLGLAGAGAVAAATTMSFPAWLPLAAAKTPTGADPFTLGVASGEPVPGGVVLWTRLAPDPLAEDGSGGMPPQPFEVHWQVASDEGFRHVERQGTYTARPEFGHSVHIEVNGLRPGRDYHYRFRAGDAVSPTGRTRTAPPIRSSVALNFAVASCAMYEHGYFTAYRHLAEENPDFVLYLGDYIYEHGPNEYRSQSGNVRNHVNGHAHTLTDYRIRYAQYKSDADLQAAHSVAPWVVTWDDHEIDNNWADEIPENDGQTRADFLRRRAAAAQAYWENMPLRHSSAPSGIDMQLYRRLGWGRLATFHVLDTRQYRSDQACGDGTKADCEERLDPNRTLTGAEQEAWLLDGLAQSDTAWNVLAQQIFFAQRDSAAGPPERNYLDSWDGYAASRDRIVNGIIERQPAQPVVLTGDAHRNYAADLKTDFYDQSSQTFGVEFVGTSITTTGDGSDSNSGGRTIMSESPHIKFFNNHRGYIRCNVTRDAWQSDFRVLPYVSEPDAPVSTRASFVTERENPGLQSA